MACSGVGMLCWNYAFFVMGIVGAHAKTGPCFPSTSHVTHKLEVLGMIEFVSFSVCIGNTCRGRTMVWKKNRCTGVPRYSLFGSY
jgi:hypothetical protein